MSGQSTCRSIAQIRENGNTNRAAIGALGNAINPVGSIVSGLSAKNNSDNAIINIIRQNARSIQDMLVKNKCDNISSLRQENIFRENPICFTSLIETCKNTITGETNLECLREVRKFLNDTKYKIYDDKLIQVSIETLIDKINNLDRSHQTIGNYLLFKDSSYIHRRLTN